MTQFPKLPKQIELMYQSGIANIDFIKKQEWAFTASALTAYGALVTACKNIVFGCEMRTVLISAIILSAVFSACYFAGMGKSLATSRAELDGILKEYFNQKPGRRSWFDRWGMFVGLGLIVATGALIAAYAVIFVRP